MYLSYEGAAEGLEGSSKGTVSLDGQETSERWRTQALCQFTPSRMQVEAGDRQGDTV